MKSIPKSGRYLPSKLGYVTLVALEDVMGKNGVNAILNLANLRSWINSYPTDTLEKRLDFADYSAINGSLDDIYGTRGGRGLAMRAGRATFENVLRGLSVFAGLGDFAIKILPTHSKLKIGLGAVARVLSSSSDQHITVVEKPDHFLYSVEHCSVCWGRHTTAPTCHMALGMLQGTLKWISGGSEFKIEEIKCSAVGDEACVFAIEKEPLPKPT